MTMTATNAERYGDGARYDGSPPTEPEPECRYVPVSPKVAAFLAALDAAEARRAAGYAVTVIGTRTEAWDVLDSTSETVTLRRRRPTGIASMTADYVRCRTVADLDGLVVTRPWAGVSTLSEPPFALTIW